MSSKIYLSFLKVFAAVLAGLLLPASGFAQAGITGNALGGQDEELRGQSGQFDKGLNSQSALEQLEEITRTTVDRSSSQSVDDSARTGNATPPRVTQPHFNADAAFKQELRMTVASTVADVLVASIFSDDSAQQQAAAETAAAVAAAQAEALRVQQELARQARVRQAQHYRAEWDSREGEVGERLDGAFEVTEGTAFFGKSANPDARTIAAILGQPIGEPESGSAAASAATESDDAVVYLRGSSLVEPPQPVPSVLTTRHTSVLLAAELRGMYELTTGGEEPTAASSSLSIDDLRAQVRERLEEKVKGDLKGKAIALFWDLTKDVPGQAVAKNFYELNGQRHEITNALAEQNEELLSGPIFGGATDLVFAMGNPNSNVVDLVARQDKELREEASKMLRNIGKRVFEDIGSGPTRLELDERETPLTARRDDK
jgi:hypothetical protein